MHIFHTFFAIFGQKIFFSKIRLRQFFGTIESYLDAKNQKKLWSRSSGIHPDVREQIYRTSQILGVGPKSSHLNYFHAVCLTLRILIFASHLFCVCIFSLLIFSSLISLELIFVRLYFRFSSNFVFQYLFRIDKILYIPGCPSVGWSVGRSPYRNPKYWSYRLETRWVDRLWSEGVHNQIWAKKVLIKGVKTP